MHNNTGDADVTVYGQADRWPPARCAWCRSEAERRCLDRPQDRALTLDGTGQVIGADADVEISDQGAAICSFPECIPDPEMKSGTHGVDSEERLGYCYGRSAIHSDLSSEHPEYRPSGIAIPGYIVGVLEGSARIGL